MLAWILVFLFSFLPSICLADSGLSGGGVFSRSISEVTDGTNTCYPYAIKVGTNSCTNGIATISTGSGSGTIGIGTANLASEYVGSGTLGPTANLYVVGNNVGIGSTAPGQTLDVQGTVRQFAGVIGSTYLANGNTPPTNGLLVQGNVGIGTASPVNVQGLSVLGGISVGTYATTTAANGGLVISGNASFGQNDPFADPGLSVLGNIGIGTFVSNHALTIGPSATHMTMDGTGISVIDNTTVSISNVHLLGSTSGTVTVGNEGTGITNIEGGTSAGSTIQLSPENGIATMFLNSSNVGIGSTTPGQKLDVQGTVRDINGVYGSSQTSPPTIASNACGTTTQGTINSGSTDEAGSISTGTFASGFTSCAVTFGATHPSAPASCICEDGTNVALTLGPTSISSTGFTCSDSVTSLASMTIYWICKWTTP